MKSKRDAAICDLDKQKAQLKLNAEIILNLQAENTLLGLQKRQAERDVLAMREELGNLRKSGQTHVTDLEEAKFDFELARLICVEDDIVTQAVNEKVGLKRELVSMREDSN
ncbi:unnamed protein product [Calypogeia fissa]